MKKKINKLLAIVLSVAVAVAMLPSMALAQSEQEQPSTLSYVALGDSMSQGYMFTDYSENVADKHGCGYAGSSERSSIKKFYRFLEEQYDGTNTKVELTDLSVQGFQPDELWALFTGNYDNLTNGAAKHFNWWIERDELFGSRQEMAEKYVGAIKNADVLTYDIGENYFGTYVGDRLGDTGVNEGGEHFTELLDCLTKEEQAQVEKLRKKMMSMIDEEKPGLSKTVDAYLYAYVSYIYYTDKCIDRIYEINPDINLIVCGLYNPHPELTITADNGKKIDYSGLVDTMMESLNLYASVINKHAANYKFADMSKNTPISFADELYYYPDDLSDDARYMLAAMICDPSTNIFKSEDSVFWDALIKEGVKVNEFLANNEKTPLNELVEMSGGTVTLEALKAWLGEMSIPYDANDTISAADTWKFFYALAGYPDYPAWDKGENSIAAQESHKNNYPFPASSIVNDLWKKAMQKYGYVEGDKESAITATERSVAEFTELFNDNGRACDWDINHMDKSSNEFKENVVPLVEPYFDICIEAMKHREFTMEEYTKLKSGNLTEKDAQETIDRLINRPEEATEFDYLMLHWQIRHGSAARGFGAHPCPRGQQAKYENIVNAYTETTVNTRDKKITSMIEKAVELIESGKVEAAFAELTKIAQEIAKNPEVKAAVEKAYEKAIDMLIEQIGEENIAKIKELKKLVEYVHQISAKLPQIYAEFEKKVKEDIKEISELTKKQMGDIYCIIEKNINNPEAMIAEIVNYLEKQGYPEYFVKAVEKQLNGLLDEFNKKVAEIEAQIEKFIEANKEKFEKFFGDVQKVIDMYNEFKAIYDKMPKSCEEWKAIIQSGVDEVCEYADTAAGLIDMLTAMVDYPEDALESFDAYRENVVTASYIKDCSMLIDLAVGMLGDLPKEVKEFISYDKLKAASEKLYEAGKNFHAAIEALGDKVSENIGDLNTTIDAMDDHISMLVNNIDKLNKDKAKLSKKYTELYTKVYAKVLPLKKGQKLVASKNIKYRTKADGVKSVKTSNKKVVKVYKKSGKYYIKGVKAKKSATVTVKFNSGVSRSYKVSVQKNAVQPKTIAVKYNGKTISSKALKKGKKIKLTVSKSPVSCVKKAVFKSSNKKVVKTSKSGIVKAYKKGTAKVTVKVGNKKKVVVFKVK